jgi:CheY-like chemotaxis protein
MRRIVTTLLRGFGIRDLREAASGEEGLDEVFARAPDFVVTDLRMPGMDGVEFVRRLRRTSRPGHRRDIPVIMMTAYSERSKVEIARDGGLTEVVAKPLTSQALMSRLIMVCDRPRPFIVSSGFVGPCRRRRAIRDYKGPMRRDDDGADWSVVEFGDD